MEDENAFKFAFIGPEKVGKSNIIERLLGNDFNEKSSSTNGASYANVSLELEGCSFDFNLWDSAGNEKYISLTKIFLRGIKGVFAVYDITDKSSFDNVDKWIELLKEVDADNVPKILIGNKCDLMDKRKVTFEEGELKAKKYGAYFIETSALSGENLENAFNKIKLEAAKNKFNETKSKKYKKGLKELINKLEKIVSQTGNLKSESYSQKDFDKLKDDNAKLNDELNKAKNIILNLENKDKENASVINNLRSAIREKDDKILNLKLKIKNIESFNKTSFNNDDIISVYFISSNHNIYCPIKCLKTNTFAEVEEKLYQKYQEYRETNNKFISKGIAIKRFKTIIENNIIDGDKIELIKMD